MSKAKLMKDDVKSMSSEGGTNMKPDFKSVRAKVKKKFRNFPKSKANFRAGRGKEYNDVGWYSKNPTILEAFAKLPFNYIVGNSLPGISPDYASLEIPAVISYNVDWVASPTCSTKLNTPHLDDKNLIDLVATIVYTRMRRANSGATNNIEHVDVIISNLLASIDIMCNVHYIHRIFRVANTFSWKNRSIPHDIFSDHWNIDFQDFIANQANYRGRFDTLVALAQTIRTLANFPFIDAAKSQFSEVFKDTDTDTGREQIIVSAKPFHHIYDPTGNSAIPGGMVRLLVANDVSAWAGAFTNMNNVVYTGTPVNDSAVRSKYNMGDLLDILQAQIYALINDSDFNLIQADIEKAFGEQSGYIVIDPVKEVSPLEPVYSGEFMTSFHNGSFFQLPVPYYGQSDRGRLKAFKQGVIVNSMYQIHENDGKVVAAQDFGYFVPSVDQIPQLHTGHLIDLDSDNPTVDEVVISTRFKNFLYNIKKSNIPAAGWLDRHPVDSSIPDGAYLLYSTCASNFITWGGNITIYATSRTGAMKTIHFGWTNASSLFPLVLLAVEQHPICVTDPSGGAIMGEINNIRYVTEDEVLPIQKACFLSLWNIPEYTNI